MTGPDDVPAGARADDDRPEPGGAGRDQPGGAGRDQSSGAGAGRDEGRGAEISSAVASLAESDLAPAQRRRILGRLVESARGRGLRGLVRPKAAVRWMVDTVVDIAPHVPVRDLATLRRHFGGLDGEELADRLVRNATRATTGVGAAGGGVASIEWVVPPTLLAAPVVLAAETVAVVAIEMKLIGELHEVYRAPVPGSAGQRAVALMQAWAQQRGVNPLVPGVGAAAVLGTAARKELRERLLRRFGRNLTTYGPLLTGAVVAGYLNRRATRGMSDQLRADLRRRGRAIGPA
jgi:hypothetical protein